MTREEQYIEVIKKQDELIVNLYQYVSQHNYYDVVDMIDRFLFPDDPINMVEGIENMIAEDIKNREFEDFASRQHSLGK